MRLRSPDPPSAARPLLGLDDLLGRAVLAAQGDLEIGRIRDLVIGCSDHQVRYLVIVRRAPDGLRLLACSARHFTGWQGEVLRSHLDRPRTEGEWHLLGYRLPALQRSPEVWWARRCRESARVRVHGDSGRLLSIAFDPFPLRARSIEVGHDDGSVQRYGLHGPVLADERLLILEPQRRSMARR